MSYLNFDDTKSTCYLAYDGAAGESYRFSDGTTWNIINTWISHITGFKAILVQPSGGLKNVTVLAFAGTDSALDVVVDLNQVVGGLAPQYPQSLSVTMQCQSSSRNLFLTGHSLGGGLAAYCSVETRLPASTINPAPLVSMASFSAMFKRNSQITNYIAGGSEVVSSSPGRNPGTDVAVPAQGNFFTRHSLINTAPSVPLPVKL